MFCKHNYKIIETYRFNSIIETNHYITKAYGSEASRLMDRGIISVIQCNLCNKIKHIKTVL